MSFQLNQSYPETALRRSSNNSMPSPLMETNSVCSASDYGIEAHSKNYAAKLPVNVSFRKQFMRHGLFRRHSSVRTTNKEKVNFADTVNRYTLSSGVSSTPQYKDIISNMVGTAAIDNHYKPKRIAPRSGQRHRERYIYWNTINTMKNSVSNTKTPSPAYVPAASTLPKQTSVNSSPFFPERFFSPVNKSAVGKLTGIPNVCKSGNFGIVQGIF